MVEKEFNDFLQKKRESGLNRFGEIQLQFAFSMGFPEEILEFMADPAMPTRIREWVYISVLEELPFGFVKKIPKMEEMEIKKQREYYLKKEENEIKKRLKEAEYTLSKQKHNQEEKQRLCVLLEEEQTKNEHLQKEAKEKELQIAKLQAELVKREGKAENTLQKEPEQSVNRLQQYLKKRRQQRETKEKEVRMMDLLRKEEWSEEQRAFLIESFEWGMRPDVIEKMAVPKMSIENLKRVRKLMTGGNQNE